MQVFDDNEFDKNAWYMAISNHQSWADIFILLVAAHKRIPLLKFFMKKELAWIPFIFLANNLSPFNLQFQDADCSLQ